MKSNVQTDDRPAAAPELNETVADLLGQLRASETGREWLRAVLANMGDGIIVVDADENVIFSNAAYDALSIGASRVIDATGEAIPASQLPQSRAARGESFTMAFRIVGAEGVARWFEAKAHPIDFAGSRLSVVSIRDISERTLRLLQEEFIALASHELRAPLTAMQAYAHLLALRPEIRSDPTLAGYVDSALAEAKRLAGLISELTEATRLQSGKLALERRRVDLRKLIEDVVAISRPLSEAQAIRFQATDDVVASVDPDRFEQVILNLIGNAVTHAPQSRYVDVDLRRVEGGAEICVTDTGPGVSPTDVALVFSRFYQVSRKDGGTERGLGLGLYISREIVRAHGGDLTIASTLGRGTTFTVRLPLDDLAAP